MISHPEALKHEEYSRIPTAVLASVYGYVDRKEAPGHFLTAVLSNDLFTAVSRADKESFAALRELVTFIHMEVPTACHGSAEAVANWLFPKPHFYAAPAAPTVKEPDAKLFAAFKARMGRIAAKNNDTFKTTMTFLSENGCHIEVIETADHHTFLSADGPTVDACITKALLDLPEALSAWNYKNAE